MQHLARTLTPGTAFTFRGTKATHQGTVVSVQPLAAQAKVRLTYRNTAGATVSVRLPWDARVDV